MSNPFKYGSATLYRTPVWVSLPSDSEVKLLLKPLPHKLLTEYSERSYIIHKSKDYTLTDTVHEAVAAAIVDTMNTFGFPSNTQLVNSLSLSDLHFLHDRVLELSVVTQDQMKAMRDMLDIQMHKDFSDDTWNCIVCKAKGLDYARACGFLDKDKRDPKPLLPIVAGKRYTECPIASLDTFVLNQMALAHNLMELGVLPEAGGLGNQSDWFVQAALIYKRKMVSMEQQALDDAKSS